MKRATLLMSLLGAGFFLMGYAHEKNPVTVLPTHMKKSFHRSSEALLFEENGVSVLRNRGAEDIEFKDLYLVRMPELESLPFFVEQLGNVMHFERRQFALVRIDEEYKVHKLSHLMHTTGAACGAVFKMDGDPIEPEIAVGGGVPVIPVATDVAEIRSMVQNVSPERIGQFIADMSQIHTRYHASTTGRGVADYLKGRYENLSQGRSDVTIETFDHGNATKQKSLVVRILGKSKPEELVLLGSHIDSINLRDNAGRAPGADDNASGTATNFEIFRILMESGYHPERTIEIHGYSAEEIGLVGSQDMARKYKAAGKNVVTMMQQDMNLYKANGAADKIWFVSNNTVSTFNEDLGKLIDRYVGVPWGIKSLFGGDSDHTSWKRQGYVTAFPFEDPSNYNRKIHTPEDTLTNANALTQSAAFGKLGISYLVHFAGL